MFGFQRRLVRRCECETDLPKPGPLAHTSQTAAIVANSLLEMNIEVVTLHSRTARMTIRIYAVDLAIPNRSPTAYGAVERDNTEHCCRRCTGVHCLQQYLV